jgi:hypothetical protein
MGLRPWGIIDPACVTAAAVADAVEVLKVRALTVPEPALAPVARGPSGAITCRPPPCVGAAGGGAFIARNVTNFGVLYGLEASHG